MPPARHPPGPHEIRDAVTARYSGLARAARSGQKIIDCEPDPFEAGCFGAAGYDDTSELPDGAVRASLGCGNPVAVAQLHPGETVLDLGSGGGIDVLLSARRVAPGGKAYGLDGSPDMITLARDHAAQAGVANVKFLHGHIEDIPLPEAGVDVVISNCVINLSADKPRVLAEAFRVLRPGGRIGVSDVIAAERLDPARRAEAERLTGCTTGTLTATEYRSLLLAAGFTSITITNTSDAVPGLHSAIVQASRPLAPDGVLIRPMRPADASQALAIYQAGLDTGQASFETTAPTWDTFDQARLQLHRHVAIDAAAGDVLGWVAASPVSARLVYRGVIEHSIYVHPGAHNRGIGAALLDALIGSTEADGIWTIQTGIFPENAASLRFHERAGFRVVGTRQRIGRHHGRWRDVTLLERRSDAGGSGTEPAAASPPPQATAEPGILRHPR
jgi:L-amino acid N-acyltransferase YncA/2-polyprenyl-3-methyl-5-hydroxy-6-metoxy-1,4-benzoquinol methylase